MTATWFTSARRRAAVAAIALVLPVATAVGDPIPTRAAACTGHILRDGAWTYPPAPTWPSADGGGIFGLPYVPPTAGFGVAPGESQVIVGPRGSQRVLISDTHSLLRSLDGGCTWSSVLSLFSTDPGALEGGLTYLSGLPGSFLNLVTVPSTASPAAQNIIYAAINNGYLHRYAVIRSNDGGATWRAITPGTQVAGGPVPQPGTAWLLSVAPSDPATLYLCICNESYGVGDAFYASRDGGNTWSTVTLPIAAVASPAAPVTITDIKVDPRNPRSLWLNISNGLPNDALHHSADGGATWSTVGGSVQEPQAAQFYWPAKAKAPWVLTSSGGSVKDANSTFSYSFAPRLSTDGGRTWKTLAPLALRTNTFFISLRPWFAFDRRGRVIAVTAVPAPPPGQSVPLIMRLTGQRWRQLSTGIRLPHGYWDLNFAQTADSQLRLVFAASQAASPDPAAAEYAVPAG